MGNSFDKDPDAVLDYYIDWSEWLDETDSVASSTWTVPDGISADTNAYTATRTEIWLSGGTAGEWYHLTNHITTTDGREDDRTIIIVCRQR